MDWAVSVRFDVAEVAAAVREAATIGREVAAAFPIDGRSVMLIFRTIPRGAPAHVTAHLVDRSGYPR